MILSKGHINNVVNLFSDDISLFTLVKSVEFNNNIRAVCLWEGNNDLSRIVGTTGVVNVLSILILCITI